MPRYQITGVATYGYLLALNPMMGNVEGVETFGPFETMDQLKAFYKNERVETYTEEGPDQFSYGDSSSSKTYRKSFRKGGPLEWMNPIEFLQLPDHNMEIDSPNWGAPSTFGHGVHEVVLDVKDIQKTFQLP